MRGFLRVVALLGLSLCLAGGTCSGGEPDSTLPATDKDTTLYDRLGGIDVLRVLVDEWLLELSSDARIGAHFAGADIAQLKLRLVERLCVQVEGPCLYRGREMAEAHADLDLEESDLRAFLDALDPAMKRAKIEEAPADELRDVVRALAEELAIAVVR
jgi:hemoglobin